MPVHAVKLLQEKSLLLMHHCVFQVAAVSLVHIIRHLLDFETPTQQL